jgi:hypothetical protein
MSEHKNIDMVEVKGSSSVLGHSHVPDQDVMHVQFKNKKVYQYSNVSDALYREITSSPSIGSAISKKFRGQTLKYPCKQIKVV